METLRRLLLLALGVGLAGCTAAATPTPVPSIRPTAAPTPTTTSPDDTRAWLEANLAPGEAVVWYLGQCGFAVRTSSHLLVFDYQEEWDGGRRRDSPAQPGLENGRFVPEQVKDLPLRVFVSHEHSDHWDPAILSWRGTVGDIAYFFGWPAGSEESCHYLTDDRATWSSDDLAVYTIHVTNEVPETAYLVMVDGLVIYHNGDWIGDFATEYAYLRTVTERIDLAFIYRGFEEANTLRRANQDMMQRFQVGALFGMHDKAGSAGYATWVRVLKGEQPSAPVFAPSVLGQRWVYRAGKIVPDS